MSSDLKDSEAIGVAAQRMIEAVGNSDATVPVLLVGEEGAGQMRAARTLAQTYLCKAPISGKPCGGCVACRTFLKGKPADVLEVAPSGLQNLIKLSQINGESERQGDDPEKVPILEFIRFGPVQARTKVVMIHDADRMNISASNALLKTLEESPDYVRFVLTSASAGSIAPTIRSRCAIVPCDYPPLEGVPEFAVRLSAGVPALAHSLQSEQFAEFSERLWRWIHEWSNRSPLESLKISEEFQQLADEYHDLAGKSTRNVRTTRAEFMKLFGNGVASIAREGRVELVEFMAKIVVVHKAVAGNVSFAYLCDSLFCDRALNPK